MFMAYILVEGISLMYLLSFKVTQNSDVRHYGQGKPGQTHQVQRGGHGNQQKILDRYTVNRNGCHLKNVSATQ